MQTQSTPRTCRGPCDIATEQADRPRGRARIFTRQRRHQFLLAVTRYPGDPEHLTGAHRETDRGQIHAELVLLFKREVAHFKHHIACGARCMFQCRRLGTNHQARQAGIGLLRRVHCAGDLAAAQYRAVMAQGADFIELVADVDNAATFAGQFAKRHKQPFHRLRRQHRSRFIENQELRPGQQGTHDLDPLALAHGECVHRSLRL